MNEKGYLKYVFEPGFIGSMSIKNRIVMAPMGSNYADKQGNVTQRLIDYYAARAKGGAGLVIVEGTSIDASLGKSGALPTGLLIDRDEQIPGLRSLARAIQGHGARAAIQLLHGGANAGVAAGLQPIAPSPVPNEAGVVPREMTKTEIRTVIEAFAQSVERAKQAGFDGVELHGAHRYIIAQFLAAGCNKRQDEYGGNIENRARFLVEVLRAIRERVGEKYPLWCRLNGDEFGMNGGLTREEARTVARLEEKAGADAIHVSAFPRPAPPGGAPRGHWIDLAKGIKDMVSVPIIAVGRMNPEVGNQFIEKGMADFVAIGRALITDPELPNKAAHGEFDKIKPCIVCDDCRGSIRGFRSSDSSLRCTVNPAAGRERENALRPIKKARTILVIGGGPAGLEAARVAATRGHKVVLCEAAEKLGGQLNLAAIPSYKRPIIGLIEYYARQMALLQVTLELKRRGTVDFVRKIRPDVVIIATGARPTIPRIPGIRQGLKEGKVVTAFDVLENKAKPGRSVAILGGELVACETAEFLAEQGKEVVIMRRSSQIALNMNPIARAPLLKGLQARGVKFVTGVKYRSWTDGGLVISTQDGGTQTVRADTVVLATGAKSTSSLLKALSKEVPEVYAIGDSHKPGSISEAIGQAYSVANSI